MTTEECVGKLAEALEPEPVFKIKSQGERSIGGFWILHSLNLVTGQWARKPVTPLTSADASERLLEMMPSIVLWYLPLNKLWCCVAAKAGEDVNHPDRRTAIFLAALAWKGIEKPEDLK